MKLEKIVTDCGDLVVKLYGEFDALGSAGIRPDLEAIVLQGSPQQVFLDLQEVIFIDSSGVGAIVFLYKRLRENSRSLSITGAHGQPRELLELLRIHKAIPVNFAGSRRTSTEAVSCEA